VSGAIRDTPGDQTNHIPARDAPSGAPHTASLRTPLQVAKRLKKLHHDNVSKTGDDWSNVQGTVFEVTDADLAKADALEAQFGYTRVSVPLASEKEAWVYLHAE
jgi:gamma-glutamylcyclotransferase (GGCT)/AIG2-like uncharacterized protein YtfP